MDEERFHNCKQLIHHKYGGNADFMNLGYYNNFLARCVDTTNWFVYKNLELVTEYYITYNCDSIVIRIQLGVHIYKICLNCRKDFMIFVSKNLPRNFDGSYKLTDFEISKIETAIVSLRKEYLKQIYSLISKTKFGVMTLAWME